MQARQDTSEGAEARMEDKRAGHSFEATAGGDATSVTGDPWREADDPFGDEAAFPSLWQQLDGDEPVARD
jgi:hypothetical protein